MSKAEQLLARYEAAEYLVDNLISWARALERDSDGGRYEGAAVDVATTALEGNRQAVIKAIDGKTCTRVDVGSGKFYGCSACKVLTIHEVDSYCSGCGARIEES